MRRVWIIAAVVGMLILAIAVTLLLQRPARPVQPTGPASPTATATPGSTSVETDGEDRQALGAKESEVATNPILPQLPHDTSYWSLEFGGVENGTYILNAKVYRFPGQNSEKVIAQQRPFVEGFVKATGQPDGTYTIRYQAVYSSSD